LLARLYAKPGGARSLPWTRKALSSAFRSTYGASCLVEVRLDRHPELAQVDASSFAPGRPRRVDDDLSCGATLSRSDLRVNDVASRDVRLL
jgi:hypothetical protein